MYLAPTQYQLPSTPNKQTRGSRGWHFETLGGKVIALWCKRQQLKVLNYISSVDLLTSLHLNSGVRTG